MGGAYVDEGKGARLNQPIWRVPDIVENGTPLFLRVCITFLGSSIQPCSLTWFISTPSGSIKIIFVG